MEVRKSLAEVVDSLDEVDDNLVIYASKEGGWSPGSQAALAYPPEDLRVPPPTARLQYLLEVHLAKDAIRVWSQWRGGRHATSEEKCEAVIYYAEHDAFLPVSRKD